MKILSLTDVEQLALKLAIDIDRDYKHQGSIRTYAIPRGGVPASYLLRQASSNILLVDDPDKADILFDDIIDSGRTMEKWCEEYPEKPFYALIDKTNAKCPYADEWVVFPWEKGGSDEQGITDNIVRILQFIGEDPNREGLLETPNRVAKAFQFWFSGYGKDSKSVLKVFEDGAEDCDEMVTVKDIPFYSFCEHHIAPIFGTVTISYIPNKRIVGLSKLSRLTDIYARRLQVQERLTNQIANALQENLNPKGVGVLIKARHMCMESRGICQQGHHTITSALRGAFLNEPETRAEFMNLAK